MIKVIINKCDKCNTLDILGSVGKPTAESEFKIILEHHCPGCLPHYQGSRRRRYVGSWSVLWS